MNSFKTDLNLMRKEWYNAFYNGDIKQLDYLEADWFISTNGKKVLYKQHQLKRISESQFNSKNIGVKRAESDVIVHEFNDIACVCGKAEVISGEETTRINFIENWVKINGGWKLQFVSFESF